ncbi:sensor histidine kinase [Streptomyces corynorhini]|uniref:Sensor histidine kinase n=1 Tax=Streptomyces corynorhini TaxID=2282652 RepID=A0A370BBU2_9ACTN|nr:sensor histidine kinase [Streptomyces corynorhini]
MVFRHTAEAFQPRVVCTMLLLLCGLAVLLSLTMGPAWLVLFVYVSVTAGAALPGPVSWGLIVAVTGVMALIGPHQEDATDLVTGLLVPALLGGFAMSGIRQLIRTTVELREARATVAELAADEERLRLARDLHDLLGHSLSLITLKSELAGRMLPGLPDRAAEQVADIERVSRQALKEVREAVTGYRKPTLPGELAGARTALAAAGVAAGLPADPPEAPPGGPLAEENEAALAWSLREAVTNVVRHSGARRRVIALTPRRTLAGPVLELTVEDDGDGASAAPYGNGLTGLGERLAAVGGTLETRASRKGFALVARVPAGPRGTPGDPWAGTRRMSLDE